MEAVNLLVQVGVFIVTAAAAAVAWWQAIVASRAQRAASRAESQAASAAERAVAAAERAASANEDTARALTESNRIAITLVERDLALRARDARFQVSAAVERWSNIAIVRGFDSRKSRAASSRASRLARRLSVGQNLVSWAYSEIQRGTAEILAYPNDRDRYVEFVVNFGLFVRNYVDDPESFEVWRREKLDRTLETVRGNTTPD